MTLFDLHPKDDPEDLFGREQELDEFIRLVKARRWVVVLGSRMVGKTSLIKSANKSLKRAGFRAVYVSLWGTRNASGLLNALVQGLNESKDLLARTKDAISHVRGMSVGPGGVSVSVKEEPMMTMRELLAAIGSKAGNCVIDLDEVQELSDISGYLLNLLANTHNTYPNLVFVFTGSRFGLVRALLEPGPSSPLYGRLPAELLIRPYDESVAKAFLVEGLKEYDMRLDGDVIDNVVNRLDGIPGWLTLYGNNLAVRKLAHNKAMKETISQAEKIVKSELDHFLEGRNREAYLAALKAAAVSARWGEVKGAIEATRTGAVNGATVSNVLEGLKAGMLVIEKDQTYRVNDPILRTLLLTAKVT
jgi:AAA+ ATPase superfamily predicted ATPase